MLLTECVCHFVQANDLCPQYVRYLHTSAAHFIAFSHVTEAAEITVEQLNAWADFEAERTSKRTAKNKFSALVKVLRNSAEEGLRPPLVGKLKRLKVPRHVVKAFTPEDVSRLLETAKSQKGFFANTGIAKCEFWPAVIRTAWDLGLRLADLLSLRYEEIDPRTLIVMKVQHKTGRVHVGQLRPETWQAIQRMRSRGTAAAEPLAFPYPGDRTRFCRLFKKLSRAAGLKGTTKFLRRGGATSVWQEAGPAAAAQYLGHADRTGQLASVNYVDWSQVAGKLPTTPALPRMAEPSGSIT